MRSAAASPRWATPPRSTGRARCRPRRSSPPCRSGSRPASTSPGSMPAAARRCGTSSTRRSASSRSWAATPASAWAAGSATRSKARPTSAALKIRSLGLGGEVYRRLGATPQTTPPAEILTSLQSGVIDAVEFVGPGTDIALGLYRVAPFYYYPGFNKPNGTGECIVSLNAWNALDAELKSIVAHACAVGSQFRAGRDGAAQHRGAGGADRPAPRAVARVSRRT